VSDIFREVEEDVRRERLEKWWKKYGDYVIAGVSVIAIAIGGYKLWQHYEEQQRLKASSEYQSAIQLEQAGQIEQAAQAFAEIAKHAPSGYALVARLSNADALLAAGRRTEAVAIYMDIAKDENAGLGDLARIRAAWAQADTLSTAELKTLLAPLAQSETPWRYMAREILAYRDFHDGLTRKAQKEYEGLAAASDAPSGLRQRAQAMATLIRTSGGRDYGKVPPPPAETPAQQGTTGR
jgi:hypothetical protein